MLLLVLTFVKVMMPLPYSMMPCLCDIQVNTGFKAANCDVTSQCLGNLEKQERRSFDENRQNKKTAAFSLWQKAIKMIRLLAIMEFNFN